MGTTTTIISRSRLTFPDLGYDEGVALEGLVKGMFTNLGDFSNSRYEEYTSIADSTTVELYHNFGADFAEYKVLLYTGTGTNLTRVQDPAGDGWTINAKAGSLKTVIEITTPASGGPHDFTVIISHGTFIESISELDDFDNTGVADGYIPIWNAGNSRYQPGASLFWNTSVKSALYTASNKDEIFSNTSGGGFTINFPASASLGDRIRIIDYDGSWSSTNKVTLSGNGNTIMGAASFDLTIANTSMEFVYSGADWRAL